MSADLTGKDFQVLRPDEEKARSAGTVQRQDRTGLVRFRDTEISGAYRLQFTGEQRPFAAFAIQMDPAEANLKALPADRLALLENKEKPGEKAAPGKRGGGIRREFWGALVALAALLAVAEMILAHRFSLAK